MALAGVTNMSGYIRKMSIDGYFINLKIPELTECGGELVAAYQCNPTITDQEFLFSKRQYATITGRDQKGHDIIAYHLRQSFKPGEITPELANKIGYELAMSLTKGKHAFIVCTHVDKQHIHSHNVFNSTTLDCSRKFKNFWGSSFAVRRISDLLCLENGLSVIENPKPSRGSYGTWLGEKPPTVRGKLEQIIDTALKDSKDFDSFLAALEAAGVEVKRGKHLAFKIPGGKRFIRCDSLGEDYSEAAIALFLITFAGFVAVPITLLHSSKISVLNSFLQEHPEINFLDLFTSAIDYLSLGITLFLGVIVYQQSQKINDLESSQYDIFIGTDGMDNFLTPLSDILVENKADRSDFSIKQGVSGGKMGFFTYLKTNFSDNRKLMFLPISLVTKNQPIIVSLKFSEISLVIIENNGRKSDPQKFINRAESIHWIFENDSRFLLGIGFMLPETMQVGQILLQIHIDVADQLGRSTPLVLSITL